MHCVSAYNGDMHIVDRIYLDYAASAPLYPEAHVAITQFLQHPLVGNPSSLHKEGRAVQAKLDRAHTTLAAIFGVHPTEVVFTSGATESNALAIRGVLAAWRAAHPGQRPQVVMSSIEHPSWRQTVLSEDAEVLLIDVSPEGVVEASAVLNAINKRTALIGCMHVNNEIGTVQPVAEIGKGVAMWREEHRSEWPVFHVDAVQAFPYCNTHLGHVRADSMTLSGHKYGALGGIGVLIVKKHTPMRSIAKGGAQEWGYRAGTENVLGALTLAAVAQYSDTHRDQLTEHMTKLQRDLESRLKNVSPDSRILGESVGRAPHISYLWLPNVHDERFVHKLDLAGVAISSGSACSSGAALPSSTLLALGFSNEEAYGGIRISYGRFTTHHELEQFVLRLKQLLV